MLIVPDVHDVYTPLQTDIIVQLTEVCLLYPIFLVFIKNYPLVSCLNNISILSENPVPPRFGAVAREHPKHVR